MPENLYCVLTPPGVGAIATFALRGSDVWTLMCELFSPRIGSMLPASPALNRFWLGRLGADTGDEVVLALRQIEPTPTVEIHCHGGREVVRMLAELFESRSVRACSWQQFDACASAPQWRIAAEEMLLQAPTVRTAAILLDQYHGAFANAVARIQVSLGRKNGEALRLLERLAGFSNLGKHLVTPFRVGIAGAPNVGKSSLVNAIAGYARSIVSPVPGTTRDVVTASLALDGWPVELFDTAGLRAGGEVLEQAGIRLATSALESADLVVWVLDGAAAPVFPESTWAQTLTVINKVDLAAAWDWNRTDGCRVSALTHEALTELCERIATRLVPEAPQAGEAVPLNAAWASRIDAAYAAAIAHDWSKAHEVLDE